MASRGSVIPLFLRQIQDGKAITVTDPNMTRFMMTIENAVDLVLYAFEIGTPGDTFVQKAASCTIGVLAEALKNLCGSAVPLNVIGTRHGEKLYETLLTREEMAIAEDQDGYYRVPADNRDLNYGKYFTEGEERITGQVDYNSHNVPLLDVVGMAALLKQLSCVQQALRGEKVEL
jgi:UDP-glucose 4-epimerase